MSQILMHGRWNGESLNEYLLDQHLEDYARGSDEQERRECTCDFCGQRFDYTEGKVLQTCRASNIRIRGNRPEELHICNYCYNLADDIELED